MKRILLAVLALCGATANAAPKPFVYGNNPAAAGIFVHDGIKFYYETYGQGAPLIVIEGNGGNIWSMKQQIVYFSKHYKVIAMDSRNQGRTGDAPGPLTYEQLADDQAALIDYLHLGPTYIVGWSDGGIEALLLGMRHPDKVKMIAAMAANLDPEGLAPEVRQADAAEAAAIKPKTGGPTTRQERLKALETNEPHIKPEALATIKAPTLVLASDHDVIADEHTLTIFHHIPNAQLAIFPGQTHMVPYADPALFNGTIQRFFTTPFVKTDRLGDLMKVVGKMKADAAADRKAAGVH